MAPALRTRSKKDKAAAPKKAAKKTVTKKAPKAAPKAVTKVAKKGSAAATRPKRNARTKINLVPKRLLDRFDGCTVAQIKTALRARNLELSGIKQDLFMRLVQDEEREPEEEDDDEEEDDEEDDEEEEEDEDEDMSSLPDYESDPPASQQAAAPAPCASAQGSCGGGSSQQAEEEEKDEDKPKGPYDCVAHFRGQNLPGPPIEDDERPLPHNFFIPQAALDTVLGELFHESPDHVGNIMQKLGMMNADYIPMKTRDVLQWHMPERYLIARMSQHYEQGLLKEPPFETVCQSTWGNKLPQDWRTTKFMAVVDAAPAFLREWSDALKANKLCYPQMPTNYAENPNQQWCFGRALLATPNLLNLFKQLVADGKLELPCKTDNAEVTEEHLAGIKW